MSAPSRRMTEAPGSEAPRPLQGAAQEHMVHVRREMAAVRPAVHVLEYAGPIARTPAQAASPARRPSLTDHPGAIKKAGGSGRHLTATGPDEVIIEAADHCRTLPGWAHDPHDTLVRVRPQAGAGFRLAHAETVR